MRRYGQEGGDTAQFVAALRKDPITALSVPDKREPTVKQAAQGKAAGLGDVMQGGMDAVSMNGGLGKSPLGTQEKLGSHGATTVNGDYALSPGRTRPPRY